MIYLITLLGVTTRLPLLNVHSPPHAEHDRRKGAPARGQPQSPHHRAGRAGLWSLHRHQCTTHMLTAVPGGPAPPP